MKKKTWLVTLFTLLFIYALFFLMIEDARNASAQTLKSEKNILPVLNTPYSVINVSYVSGSIVSGSGIVADSHTFNFGTGNIFWSVASTGLGYIYKDYGMYFANTTFASPCPLYSSPRQNEVVGYSGAAHIWDFHNAADYTFTNPRVVGFGAVNSPCYTGVLFFHEGSFYGGLEFVEVDSQTRLHYNWWYDSNGGSDFSSLQPQTDSISGRVTDGRGVVISGVSISDGAGHTSTTDSSGNYSFGGLMTGTYTLTPSKSGYTFLPASRVVIVPPIAARQDFTGRHDQDIGFRPDPNGYQFSNGDTRWGQFPASQIGDFTTADLRQMFGDPAVCIMNGSECNVKTVALDWWRMVNQKMNGGHCDGFSTTSLRFFKGLDHASSFQKGAVNAHDLQLNDARRHIAYYWVLQVPIPVASARIQALAFTPAQVLTQLQFAMSGGAPNPTTLLVYNGERSSGHSIVPYALQDRGNGVWWVSVYDNNYPNDENRHVIINTTTDTWSYDLGVSIGTWNGDANAHSFGVIAISAYSVQPVCPWCTSTLVDELWLAGEGHLLITDSQGRRIGYTGSQFVSEIPDAYANVIPTGLGTASEPVYYLPITESYTILVDGQTLNNLQTTQTEPSSVSLFGPNYAISVDGVIVTSVSQDIISVSVDGKQLDYQSNRDEEVTLSLMLEGAGESSEFKIMGADIGSGQTMRLADNTSNHQFSFNNAQGGGGVYDLEIIQINASGKQLFIHKDITIDAGDTQFTSYGTWDGGLGAMDLLIDHGSDGTINETIVLDNQVFLIYLPLVRK